MNHWDGRVNLLKVYLVPGNKRELLDCPTVPRVDGWEWNVYLQLVDGVLSWKWLFQSQSNHFPRKIVVVYIVHGQIHVGVEVELIHRRRLGRLATILPPIHITIAVDSQRLIGSSKVWCMAATLGPVRVVLKRQGHGFRDVPGDSAPFLRLQQRLYLFCTLELV